MTEIWQGTIDSRMDVERATGQTYSCYVLSGSCRDESTAVAANDDDEEAATSVRERVIIRDRDMIVLPHVGMTIQVALTPAKTRRSGYRTFTVVRLIFARPTERLSRSVLNRALCSGTFLCKARADRIEAKVNGRAPTGLRDAPVTHEATQYVSTLLDKPSSEACLLLKDTHRLKQSLFRGIGNYFIQRHVFFDKPLSDLLAMLKPGVLILSASALASCSIVQLRAITRYVERTDAFSCLFGVSSEQCVERYAVTQLDQPLVLESSLFDGVIGAAPQALDPLETMMVSSLAEFHRRTTAAQCMRDLDSRIRQLQPDCEPKTAETAFRLQQDAIRQLRYGQTVFAHPQADVMEELGLWLQVDSSSYARRRELLEFTTPLCRSRAEQLVVSLRAFSTVVCATIEGGCRLLDPTDLASLLGGKDDVSFIVAPTEADEAACIPVGRTAFALEEVLAGREWSVRAACCMSNVLVVCEAHRLSEVDLLRLLLCYRQLTAMAARSTHDEDRWAPIRLVLVGDAMQQPSGWCAGAPFADIVASHQTELVSFVASPRRLGLCNPLAGLAAVAYLCNTAEMLVDALLRRRKYEQLDAIAALRNGSQFVFWVNSMVLAVGLFSLLHESMRSVGKRSRGDDADRTEYDATTIEALGQLRKYPHMMRNSVFINCPFVLLNGASVRVAAFYRLVDSPARNSPIDPVAHCRPAVPVTGLVSLDADNLLLRLASSPTVDHRMCCNTNDRCLLRVVCHRRQLAAGSFMLGRDAAQSVQLAGSVAVCVLPGDDGKSIKTGGGLCWNESALCLVKLTRTAEVVLLAPKKAGDNESLGRALVRMFSQPRSRQPSALAHCLSE